MHKAGWEKVFASLYIWKKFAEMKGDKGDFVPKNKYLLMK